MPGVIGLIAAVVTTLTVAGTATAQTGQRQDFVPRWSFETAATVRHEPLPVGDLVYLASQDGNLYAVAIATGEKVWRQTTEAGFPLPPVVADVGVYVANQKWPLQAPDAETGEVTWYSPQRTTIASAIGATDGFLFVADQDGAVTAWEDLTT